MEHLKSKLYRYVCTMNGSFFSERTGAKPDLQQSQETSLHGYARSDVEFMLQMAKAALRELKNSAGAEIHQLLSRLDAIAADARINETNENILCQEEPCICNEPDVIPESKELILDLPDLKRCSGILDDIQKAMQALETETRTKWNKDSLGAVRRTWYNYLHRPYADLDAFISRNRNPFRQVRHQISQKTD